MLIFLYGSLRDPALLGQIAGEPGLGRSLRPAALPGFTRVHIGAWNGRYASLARHPGRRVEGCVTRVSAQARMRLIAYEGTAYRFTRLRAVVDGRPLMVGVWVAHALTRRAFAEPEDPRRVRLERATTRHA